MIRMWLIVIAAFLSSGCYTSSNMPAFGNFGGPGFHSVNCSRDSGSWAKCHQQANELCAYSGGYYVIGQNEDRFGNGPGLSPVVLRTLYIRCFPSADDLVDYEQG